VFVSTWLTHANTAGRSSLSVRVSALTHVGGVNSIENFARSWQRAAGFVEIPSRTPSFILSEHDEGLFGARQTSDDPTQVQHRSLLRQQLEREESSSTAVVETSPLRRHDGDSPDRYTAADSTLRQESDVIGYAPYLASPFATSYGGIYGSLSSRVNESSMRHAGRLFQEQQLRGEQEPDKEHEPLLVKYVEREDGKVVPVIVGQSTLPQTVFNSVNVLIGVGLLSLPLGIKYSGWLVGMIFLFFAAIVTRYTAGLLSRCLDVDDSLVTFADLAYVSFGSKARIATSLLFTFELLAACVALVVLFADSLDALIPGLGLVEWKVFCGVILIPLCFVPLRLLSFTSVLGIVSCLGSKQTKSLWGLWKRLI
jgi:vesicular inhibitory amino acid transporter